MPPDAPARRNSITGAIAVRMNLSAPRQWLVVDLTQGGRYADADAVAGDEWVDLVEVP